MLGRRCFPSILLASLAMACADDGGGVTSAGTGGSGSATASASSTAGSASTSATTTTGTTTMGTTTGSSTTGTGELPPGDECVSDSDCIIDDDCCHCFAYGELPESHTCDTPTCDQTKCAARFSGLQASAVCVDGNCRLAQFDCDPSHVTCADPAPECGDLDAAAIVDGCWGPCIQGQDCEGALYPGATCPEGTFELAWTVCSGDACGGYNVCVPDIEGCPDPPTCDCGVDALCGEPPWDCYDRGQSPPNCCQGGDPGACST